jgi:cyclophilin family peptidyl-prolyl cis-trans isomerase
MTRRLAVTIMALLSAAVCWPGCTGSRQSEEKAGEGVRPEQQPMAEEAARAPEAEAKTYKVKLDTSEGPIVIEIHPDWAPIGAARFRQLVEDDYYDGARFFRVVPNFVIQFGIARDPKLTAKWDKQIDDDPVKQTNRVGSVSFATAGPNTRTAQVFINLRSNQSLDSQGFAPFGMIVEGMDIVQRLYSGYGEQPDQEMITKRGNSYLQQNFPNLDYIKDAEIIE